jgi:hypothetical protein
MSQVAIPAFEKRPVAAIMAPQLEAYLHALHNTSALERVAVAHKRWLLRQRIVVAIADLQKFGVHFADVNNAHIGEDYPVPRYINHILSKFPAYGRLVNVVDGTVTTILKSDRPASHWEITFNTTSQLLCCTSRTAIRARM